MNTEEFWDKQYEVSFTAGMNQRYHQHEASKWRRCDRVAKITVAVLATVGLSVTVTSVGSEWPFVVAMLSLIASIVLNVVPFSQWSSDHAALHGRWCELREDADAIWFDVKEDKIPTSAIERLREVEKKVHRICGHEIRTSLNKTLLDRCYEEEKTSRHYDTSDNYELPVEKRDLTAEATQS